MKSVGINRTKIMKFKAYVDTFVGMHFKDGEGNTGMGEYFMDLGKLIVVLGSFLHYSKVLFQTSLNGFVLTLDDYT